MKGKGNRIKKNKQYIVIKGNFNKKMLQPEEASAGELDKSKCHREKILLC